MEKLKEDFFSIKIFIISDTIFAVP